MIQISKKFTRFTWYGPNLVIAGSGVTPPAWASRVNFLRGINDAGTGPVSYKFGRAVNSLGTAARPIKTGEILELDALNIVAGSPGSFFEVDNGEAPTAAAPETIVTRVPAGGVPTPASHCVAGRFTLSEPLFTQGAGTVTYRLGSGAYTTLSAFLAQVAARTDAELEAAGLPFTFLVTPFGTEAVTVQHTSTPA
ncbi:hypothetical protein [Hymenobacter koreensis]|uniref:Phage tail protein n=1 Tax=Hymenobacter koreensis TaxID=1084523 RepID=A0ABP8JJQ6_9BACT